MHPAELIMEGGSFVHQRQGGGLSRVKASICKLDNLDHLF